MDSTKADGSREGNDDKTTKNEVSRVLRRNEAVVLTGMAERKTEREIHEWCDEMEAVVLTGIVEGRGAIERQREMYGWRDEMETGADWNSREENSDRKTGMV